MTKTELENKAVEIAEFLDKIGMPEYAEDIRHLRVSYRTQCILVDNYQSILDSIKTSATMKESEIWEDLREGNRSPYKRGTL